MNLLNVLNNLDIIIEVKVNLLSILIVKMNYALVSM